MKTDAVEVEHLQKSYESGAMPIKDLSCEIEEGDPISAIYVKNAIAQLEVGYSDGINIVKGVLQKKK